MAAADRTNLDGSIYVVQSTGPYTGSYRAYVNNVSTSSTNSRSNKGASWGKSWRALPGRCSHSPAYAVCQATSYRQVHTYPSLLRRGVGLDHVAVVSHGTLQVRGETLSVSGDYHGPRMHFLPIGNIDIRPNLVSNDIFIISDSQIVALFIEQFQNDSE